MEIADKNQDLNYLQEDNSISLNNIIRDVGKQSLKAAKWFVIISIVFAFMNLLYLIVAFASYFSKEASNLNLIYLIANLFIGIGITVVAFSFTYKYILIDTLSIVYKYLTPFFKKLSIIIIEKVSSKAISFSYKEKIQNSLNIGNILLEVYGRKVPKLLQKAILYLLKKIPFSDFIFNMKSELEDKKSNNLSALLYQQIDQYIRQSIFLTNNMKWIVWLLPLNVVIQIILIYLIK